MKLKLLSFLIVITASKVLGQASGQLNINNINANVYSNGTLFDGAFEVPAGSFKNSIYLSSFWIGGKDSTGQLHIASQVYGQAGNDLFYGPIATNYSDPSYLLHDAVYKINRTTINDHILNYQNSGYIVPNELSRWPGNGNVANGEAASLAPYADINLNGTYDPANGDYPLIRGDQAIYFIFNDAKSVHTETGGASLGLEFHAMLYGYNSPDPALNESVFLNLEIYNRSDLNYDSTYFGLFVDMDLGGSQDDLVGYDSLKKIFYTYNASSFDLVYGSIVPAQGCLSLNNIPSRFITYNNDNTNQGNPVSANDYYNYLKGKWLDESPLTFGGNGIGGNSVTNYMYTGFPEWGFGWTEIDVLNTPGDRRGLMTFGPFSFESQEQRCYDFAFPFAFGNGSPENAIQNVRTRSATLQNIYDSCSCTCSFHTSVIPVSSASTLKFYPNPSNGKFQIDTEKLNLLKSDVISVYSSIGNLIIKSNTIDSHHVVDLSEYPDGIYFAKITSMNKIYSAILIKD
ncbi:MAG: T9SS type A sorting domain-containing protein [Bacteroidetes bacterium]|nr:T9SS type A sorting domain-containing protein [Bacteroidota bacterium]MBK9414292.1 T9SS type A sorting domain-containing protein [Bacteroidota bacterium]